MVSGALSGAPLVVLSTAGRATELVVGHGFSRAIAGLKACATVFSLHKFGLRLLSTTWSAVP